MREKHIKKIVLTGGPAAGKTSLTSRVVKEFSEKGYRIFIVPETATDLISGFGIKPFGGCMDMLEFQDYVFTYQIEKEALAEKAAHAVPEKDVLILCDRGLLDNKAYVTESQYHGLLEKFGKTEISARDGYDAVIHLVSSAKGAEAFYDLQNKARTETVEQARVLDDKTLSCWVGHPCLRVIDNSTPFEEKLSRAMKELYNIVGEPAPLEIKKRYLIAYPDFAALEVYHPISADILQTYLYDRGDGFERRIRMSGKDNDYSYFYTQKKRLSAMERVQIERKIDQEDYLRFLMQADTSLHAISKKRYCFVYDTQYFKIDVYPFSTDRALMELELTDEKQAVKLPPQVQVIEDVSQRDDYKNYALAQRQSL